MSAPSRCELCNWEREMTDEIEGPCRECGSEDGPGFVNFGCVNDDCSGCDRCDLPCRSCNPGGLVR